MLAGAACSDTQVPAAWHLDSRYPRPTAQSTAIHVLVSISVCASGRPVSELIGSPTVSYDNDAIRIAFTAKAPSGPQHCQGSPPASYAIVLRQAIGARSLIDLSFSPGRERYPEDQG